MSEPPRIAALDGVSLTADELGALAGITGRRARDLCAAAKVARGQYDAESALRILLERTATPEAAGLTEERTLLVRAQRQRAELQLAKDRGDVALLSEFQRAQEKRNGMIQARLLQVPGRATLQIVGERDESRVKEVLTKEIREALTLAADDEITPEDLMDDADEPNFDEPEEDE